MKCMLVLLTVASAAFAAPDRRVARRVRAGTEVLQTRMESGRAVPQGILDSAQCVASLRMVKAGFIFGGEGSVGLVSCRLADGSWSAPSFLNLGGFNFGLQIGVQVAESVLLFMTDYSRQILGHGTFKLGADLSAAAGPVGEGVGVDVTPNAHVLTYSRAGGLYAGITLNGVVLTHAPRLNQEAYGFGYGPRDILALPGNRAPQVVRPYVEALEAYSRQS